MITPSKVKIEDEETTDEDIALEVKRTELLLKRAKLKMGWVKPIQHDTGCEIQHTGKCNCQEPNYYQKCPECQHEQGHSKDCPHYEDPVKKELVEHPTTGEKVDLTRIPF